MGRLAPRATRAARRGVAGAALAAIALTGAADARPTVRKSIWGPVEVDGRSQFPIYSDLGAGLFHSGLFWDTVAPVRPANPRDPADPAYRWPADIDQALHEGGARGIQVSLQVAGAPPWANGGRSRRHAPRRPDDFGDFLAAAAARYPQVRHWVIWGEPTKRRNFLPPPQRGRRYATAAPRHYARLLAAGHRALKRASRRNLVIGGNTYTVGDIRAPDFIRRLRLPSGRPPPMDMYGHNPFTLRRPSLARSPIGGGVMDFSDLDTLARLVDRHLGRAPSGRRLRLFLAEFTLPTDHPNWEFNFWVTRRVQAAWLADALRIARRWRRIYTLGWHALYDDPPRPRGDEVNRGLIDGRGRRKPAYFAFRSG